MFRKRKKRRNPQPGQAGFPLENFLLVSKAPDPRRAILIRAAIAVGLIMIVAVITWLDRDGYIDANNPGYTFNFLDSLYYATVTITTTGYGDMVPSSQFARFISIVVVTPLRVLFLVLLVGTTLEALTTESRKRAKVNARRRELIGHTIICGYGVKGRSALEYLMKHDAETNAFVIDDSKGALRMANRDDLDGILGKAFDRDVLNEAMIKQASKLIVALNTDEVTILTVLRARELNPSINIVASCRREENVELIKGSGADEVIVSASSAGRILGMAADAPDAARVVNDLLTFGDGLDIDDRIATENGEDIARPGTTPIAVIRYDGSDGGRILRPGFDEEATPLRKGDRVVFIATRKDNEIALPDRRGPESGPVTIATVEDDLGE